MKTAIQLLLVICSLTLFSCEKKEKHFSSTSPDGKIKIDIYATKASVASPWVLNLDAMKNGEVSSIQTEFYVDEPGKDNLIFTWTDNNSCNIILIERDGTTRNIPVILK